MRQVLLVASTTGYQIRAFDEAARGLGIDLVLASDRCHVLDDPWGDRAVAVRFEEPLRGLEDLRARGAFDGIVAVGDRPAVAAAWIAEALGLRFSSPDAVTAAGNKMLAREKFKSAGLLTPEFLMDGPPARYPCVLKPLGGSASRGVIRANDESEFFAARERIRKNIGEEILVEDFIPGREFALEGIVSRGRLHVFALFDKPDPLNGPFFEETIYVTPSRETDRVQREIFETAQRAAAALGLTDGPVHAEMRVNDAGVWMLEVAARPIGGLCAAVVRFEGGVTLEEVILRAAIGEDVSRLRPERGSHGVVSRGVMMIPVPGPGILVRVEGLERAGEVAGIEGVTITAKEGQRIVPLPEGTSYPGFIFARGDSPEEVEHALREAHSRLHFELAATLPVVR